jgi:mannitol-1-/sugar-/sorbitol-6-phosphatase
VVGVGPRAASYEPTAHVADLTRLKAEPLADGGVRLHFTD